MNSGRRKSSLTSVGSVLQSLLQNSKSELSDQFLRWKLWGDWTQVVGPTLGKCSEPIGYKKGCLYIWVNNSSRLQELTFMVTTVRDKVNEHVGKRWVRSIRFTLDRRDVPKSEEGAPLREALSKSLSKDRDFSSED